MAKQKQSLGKTLPEKRKPWYKLNKAEKRVRIAEDVLLQLKTGKFVAGTGYFSVKGTGYSPRKGQLQDELLKPDSPVYCIGCAKGAIFAALVQETNGVTIKQALFSGSSSKLAEKNLTEFTKNQLDLIETAYEKHVIRTENDKLYSWGGATTISKEAIRFGKRYMTSERRLVGIMKNIIKNKGYFIPGKILLK